MFRNLVKEMRSKGVTYGNLAKVLGVSEKTVWNKLSGQTDFTLAEVRIICETLFPEFRMDYLFRVFEENEKTA